MAIGKTIDLAKYLDALEPATTVKVRGRVSELTGLVIKAAVAGVRQGEVVEIRTGKRSPVLAEVVGFKDDQVMLMPLGEPQGIGLDSEVIPTGKPFAVKVGGGLLGHILDGLGQPLDGKPLPSGLQDWPVERSSPNALSRRRVLEPLQMGVKAIDGLLTFGEGQRVGLFAGSGVGKSTLMGQIARNTKAELNVICLVGERGREVRDFIEESLGEEGMARSVVVVATSDAPSLVRLKATYVATAIAEYFAEVQQKKVMFMLDSITRFARAQREVGLAIGEPPARQGYPPSVFAVLPRLLERTGNREVGGITALYTVLVAGGDMDEPIADEVRGILDGHIILDRKLGARNHWPAIDVLNSLSRVMTGIVAKEHKTAAGKLREVLATYEKQRDLITLGAYQYGTDEKTDYAIDHIEAVEAFLRQATDEKVSLEESVEQLTALFA
jgi:type III secretion protein N (ATPase)